MSGNEVMNRWNELGVANLVGVIGKKLYPGSNHCPVKVRGDGLVEMTVEQHDGFEDENPVEYMRFSFDGSNLLVSMSKDKDPSLQILKTEGLTKDTLMRSLQEVVIR
jgi:hypothetical protein